MVIDVVSQIFMIAFPIALIFMICQKLVFIFTSFIAGKQVKF